MLDLPIRSYAHIGDAVYEVFIREKTVFLTSRIEKLHKITISLVNAKFQANLLGNILDFLDDEEKEIVRRARNASVTVSRRANHTTYRLSTALEALIGYLYLNNPERLKEIYNYMTPFIEEELSKYSSVS